MRAQSSEEQCDAFNAAVAWLRRPALTVGFADQLRLHSFYLQAIGGDADEMAPPQAIGRSCHNSALAAVKLTSWRALRGMAPTDARCHLPLLLAQLDPAFLRKRPELPSLASRPNGLVTCGWLERFLPQWHDAAATRRKMLLAVCLSAACCSRFRHGAGFRPRRSILGAAFILASAYLSALAYGLPAWVHAGLWLQLGGDSRPEGALTGRGASARRFSAGVACALVPRVSRPLLLPCSE